MNPASLSWLFVLCFGAYATLTMGAYCMGLYRQSVMSSTHFVLLLNPMASFPQSQKQLFSVLFWLTVAVTLVVWILRGFSILAFLPGVILWVLLLLCIGLGVLSQVSR